MPTSGRIRNYYQLHNKVVLVRYATKTYGGVEV
jgi:hypothetical protein